MDLSRDRAIDTVKKYIESPNLIKHSIASGAVMKKLAIRLAQDPIKWEITGIIHDIDVEITKTDPTQHTKKAVEILEKEGFENDIIEAVKMHNWEVWGVRSENPFHVALRASETVTGLIVASAMVLPDKKLASLSVESVLKRFKDKRFAAGAKREVIAECEKLGITLGEFISLAVEAMKEVSAELGL